MSLRSAFRPAGRIVALAACVGAAACPRARGDDPAGGVDVGAVLEQAIRMVELVESDRERGQYLGDIAVAQARFGRREAAEATFRRAEGIAGTTVDDDGGETLWKLVIDRAVAGFRDEALAARTRAIGQAAADRNASNWSDESLRRGDADGFAALMAGKLARHPARSRATLWALMAARSARDGDRPAAHRAIAAADAALKQWARPGLNESQSVRLAYVLAHCRLAWAEARAGDREGAEARLARTAEAAASIAGPAERAQALGMLGIARIASGADAAARADFAEADRLVETLVPIRAIQGLVALGGHLADAGDAEGSRAAIDRARGIGPANPSRTIVDIAWFAALVATKDWDAARALLDAPNLQARRPTMVRDLTRARARAGEAAAALDLAESEAEPSSRLAALVGLLEGVADRGADLAKGGAGR